VWCSRHAPTARMNCKPSTGPLRDINYPGSNTFVDAAYSRCRRSGHTQTSMPPIQLACPSSCSSYTLVHSAYLYDERWASHYYGGPFVHLIIANFFAFPRTFLAVSRKFKTIFCSAHSSYGGPFVHLISRTFLSFRELFLAVWRKFKASFLAQI
jgi:hypothetical protein